MTESNNNTAIHNIGILAHVDAGKTTLTEQMLYVCGETRSLGSVDKGTSITDNLMIERERGISVRLAATSFNWNNHQFNIIDTPGHIDFCAEVERSLRALDAVVLVLSAVEGVQGHSLSIFEAIKSLNIPCLIFINKIDRLGANVNRVMAEIKQELTPDCLLLHKAINQGNSDATIEALWTAKNIIDINHAATETNTGLETVNHLIEQVVETDETLLESFLENKAITFKQLEKAISVATQKSQLIPVVIGVAKNTIGISQLLDAMVSYLPASSGDNNKSLSAIVFKIEFDKTLGKLAYLRVFNGQLKAREIIINSSRQQDEKVNQLKKLQRGKLVDIEVLSAGDMGIASGLTDAKIGDIYGDVDGVPAVCSLSTPLLTLQVKPDNQKKLPELVRALTELTQEDPLLNLTWLPVERELHINISGKIQVEVLDSILKQRFDIQAKFSEPSIIYKETPIKMAYGYERYWMPKPCWAILKLKIEPAEIGSGVIYQSNLSVNDIAAKYQNEIQETIGQALQQGPKGWQVTDLKISLVEGEDHNVHTRPGDYIIATPMAIMNGLVESGSQLLEPILAFTISASNDLLGTITNDISKRRGSFESPKMSQERFIIKGKIPAATSIDYPVELASLSAGKAKITTRFSGYEPCTLEQGKITDYRGVSPLDRDKWILKARGAIK